MVLRCFPDKCWKVFQVVCSLLSGVMVVVKCIVLAKGLTEDFLSFFLTPVRAHKFGLSGIHKSLCPSNLDVSAGNSISPVCQTSFSILQLLVCWFDFG